MTARIRSGWAKFMEFEGLVYGKTFPAKLKEAV